MHKPPPERFPEDLLPPTWRRVRVECTRERPTWVRLGFTWFQVVAVPQRAADVHYHYYRIVLAGGVLAQIRQAVPTGVWSMKAAGPLSQFA